MQRILLVNLAKIFGGAEVRALTQLQALQGHVEHCAIATLQGSQLHQRVVQENLPHHALSTGRGNPAMLLKLNSLIKDNRYQVVDAHNVHSILWSSFATGLNKNTGCVATIHSDFGKEYPGIKGEFYEGVLKITRPFIAHYITVTDVLQQKSINEGLADRSSLIPNAIPVPDTPLQGKVTDLYDDWGFASDDFVIGIIARLNAVKGHKYLIDAFKQLADLPRAKLLIVGDGPLDAELKAQVKNANLENRIHFTGFRNDIPHILQSIDCMCMASLSEALPYAILEAASFARPIIATSVGGLVDLLKNQETAFMVPSQDTKALADAIRWMLTNQEKARQIGINGYHMVKQSFSVDTMIKSILEVYSKVAI